MTIFTGRPQKILGNVAVASLVAGAPIGLIATTLAGIFIQPKNHTVLEWLTELGKGLLLGPFFIFIAGIVLVLPILTVLRRFNYGGPFFVYAISVAFSLAALHDNLAFGAMVMIFSMSASYVFCRGAYSDANY
jgi:hypothetical protein